MSLRDAQYRCAGKEGHSVPAGVCAGSDLRAVALALAFWHLAAATVPVVNMSRYPDSAALTPTFALHAALGVGFAVLLWHHDTIVDSDFVIGW